MNSRFKLFSIILLFGLSQIGFAQTDTLVKKTNSKIKSNQAIIEKDFALAKYKINGGDTIVVFPLHSVDIISPRIFASSKEQSRYNELLILVKSVYPYAKLAGKKLQENESKMKNMDESDRKSMMKKLENDLDQEFGGNIRDLSQRQGKILLKLIDRETGYTSYELLTDLRGSFRAFFYNGMGKLFGYNLKEKYDPKNNKKRPIY